MSRTIPKILPVSDTDTYRRTLARFLKKIQTFDQYMMDPTNPPKKYIDLDFAVFFQCYKRPRATFEALQSLRAHYPDVRIHLISDDGDDFAKIARHFRCDYTHERNNVNSHRNRRPFETMCRLFRTCKGYRAPWIVYMEDDVRVRDRISKYPDAHIAGPSGPRFTPQAEAYLRRKYPNLEINGYNGCGGCIFQRIAFLKAYSKIDEVKRLPVEIDRRIHRSSDALLTFIFLNAGFVARRWLDHSEEYGKHPGPASAFDHQLKAFYNAKMDDCF